MTDEHETILGPPGTGKTQTNSNRIRDCIEDGIPPDRIACVSFTRIVVQSTAEKEIDTLTARRYMSNL